MKLDDLDFEDLKRITKLAQTGDYEYMTKFITLMTPHNFLKIIDLIEGVHTANATLANELERYGLLIRDSMEYEDE